MHIIVARLTASLLALTLLVGPVAAAHAADPAGEPESETAGPPPLRLGFTAGEVRFWRPGTEGWVPAQVNIPLAAGDQLVTDHLGNAEVQTGPSSFLRIWGDSRLALTSHEENALHLGLGNGYLGLDLRSVEPGERVRIDTPHAALTIAQPGYYRVDVATDHTSVIARRGGRATVTARGHTVSLGSDQHLIAGSAKAAPETAPAPQMDAWDRWSIERTDTLLAAASSRYLAPQMYGAADLDRYGTWREEPTYGPVWEPRGVPVGWVPYSTGTWIADPVYGWTWVDTAPWGWAPYHHGRWVFVNGGWAWAPGPRVVRAVYAPALVAFFGEPHPVGRPFVSWVALGWGEPCVPWWGRPGFVGRPWYGGWGGPRHWHRDHFHGRPLDYRNVRVRNAVVGMDRERFGRERVERARVTTIDVKRLQPVREPRPVVREEGGGRGTPRPGSEARERQRDEAVTLPRPIGVPDRQVPPPRDETPRRDRGRDRAVTPPGLIGPPDDRDVPRPEPRPRERSRDRAVTPPEPIGVPDEAPRPRPTPQERPRDRAVTPPGPIGVPDQEGPSPRPDTPRERQRPGPRSSELDTGDEPRAHAVPPQGNADPPTMPRVRPSLRATPPPQHWRRAGEVTRPPAPPRAGGLHRERENGANAQGGSPQGRGRR